ncbi:MAG TPA: efflux RND transporter periplasmic adaptor subunit [Pyrinomonadaceae bacterium]
MAVTLLAREESCALASSPGARSLLSLCCLLAVALAAAGCKSGYPSAARQSAAGEGGKAPKEVKTARVVEMPVGQTITVSGTLAAQDQATVSVKVPGRLGSISVDLGSVVRRGQSVAQVEAQDYKLRVQQAEASLAQARARLGLTPDGADDRVNPENTATVRQARAQLDEARASRERAVKLVEQGVIARAEYEREDASFKVAQGRYQDSIEEVRNRQGVLQQRRTELALARQQLADTVITAPFDGVVQEKKASVGEYLGAGAPVVTIVRVNPLRFRAEVPEREAQTVHTGQQMRITVEGEVAIFVGRVVRLSPTITEQNRILVVEAEVANNGRLRPGSFARADIVTSDASMAVTVPSRAVTVFAGIEKVIIVQNNKALEKPVTTGRRADDWTEILSGVNVGDTVVIDPGNLQSGQPIKVAE